VVATQEGDRAAFEETSKRRSGGASPVRVVDGPRRARGDMTAGFSPRRGQPKWRLATRRCVLVRRRGGRSAGEVVNLPGQQLGNVARIVGGYSRSRYGVVSPQKPFSDPCARVTTQWLFLGASKDGPLIRTISRRSHGRRVEVIHPVADQQEHVGPTLDQEGDGPINRGLPLIGVQAQQVRLIDR
jgi:hypothetical protein